MFHGDTGLSGHGALFTDLYELTMVQSYLQTGMDRPAVFELFFRTLPANRNFLVAAGLDRVLSLLEDFQFDDDDLKYLQTQAQFSKSFLDRLQSLRFTGDVYAAPEGTCVFANEPLVQVVAPLPEAQLVETLVLNQVQFASLAATKGARCVTAAAGRRIVDFGSRRAHGIDAALTAARASYLAGAEGTSLVEAGRRYGIPTFGTMAHSYVQAHDDEFQAFRKFTEQYPGTTLLVDTYDTLAGVRKVVELCRRLGAGASVGGIRLDSGDLAELARRSRAMLDEAGLRHVQIFASSELNEYKIERLVAEDVPIDAFGIGTALAVSDDAPALDLAYKLVEYDGRPRTKLSPGKVLYPVRKQVFRQIVDGRLAGDCLARHDAQVSGQPLLKLVMANGRRLDAGLVTLEQSRQHARTELTRLPEALQRLTSADAPYPVDVDPALQEVLDRLRQPQDQAASAHGTDKRG